MTESESVALPFGDSPMFFCCASQQNVLYSILFKNASTFLNFFQKILQDSFREILAEFFFGWQEVVGAKKTLHEVFCPDKGAKIEKSKKFYPIKLKIEAKLGQYHTTHRHFCPTMGQNQAT